MATSAEELSTQSEQLIEEISYFKFDQDLEITRKSSNALQNLVVGRKKEEKQEEEDWMQA